MKYNEFVEKNKIPAKIDYSISINKNLLKYEITDINKAEWPNNSSFRLL